MAGTHRPFPPSLPPFPIPSSPPNAFINRIEVFCHGSIIVCIQFQDLSDPMNH